MATIDDTRPPEGATLGTESLGPFSPPPGYRFETELESPPPRERPAELNQGRYALKRRGEAWGLLLAGAITTGLGPMPIVKTIGLYFLPLAYLTWIGLVILVFGGIALVRNLFGRGPYRYIEEGLPLVARIRALALEPTVMNEGQPARYAFASLIEYPDPETGELTVVPMRSNDFAATSKDQLTTSYRVGDYATAVYLPSDPAGTLRLYGFLDLRPGLGVVRRDRVPEVKLIKTLLTIALIFGFFASLFWSLYAIGRFEPLNISVGTVLTLVVSGGIVLGGALLWAMISSQARQGRLRDARNAEAAALGEPLEPVPVKKAGRLGAQSIGGAILALIGLFALGGLITFCGAITANALLDRSPAKMVPVQIDDMIQVTHKALFREYKIKYRMIVGDTKKREFLSTPAHMIRFRAPVALAEVHQGRLGWPWVKEIHPLLPGGAPDDADGP